MTEDTTAASPKPAPSKAAIVTRLLARRNGVTLAEIGKETGWQPHSIRAFLTGLRKKGAVIIKDKRGDVICYRIEGGA